MAATIRPVIDAQIIPKRKTPKIKSNSNAGNRRDAQSANFARKRIKTGISTPPAVAVMVTAWTTCRPPILTSPAFRALVQCLRSSRACFILRPNADWRLTNGGGRTASGGKGGLMTSNVRIRFWVEAGLAALCGFLAILTLFTRDWVEALTGFDPDNHNGSFEWVIVAALLVVCILFSIAARADWRRLRSTALAGT
jgi:hypothetical protein